MARPKKATTSTTTPVYEISIDFGDQTVTAEGSTLLEALQSVKRPTKIVGKTFVSITNGDRSAELMYLPMKAKRLFFPNAQVYLAKQLGLLLR